MKKFSLISLMIVFICGLIFASTPKLEAKTLKIGVIAGLTGPVSVAAIPHLKTTQLCADWINAQGGITIKGEKYLIELIVEDQKDTADSAIAAATKLVEFHKAKFLVGSISPMQTAAVASITEPAHVLRSIWHGEGAPMELNPDTPYTFRVPVVPRDFAPALLKYQVKVYPDAKKTTMLFIDVPAADFLFEKTKKEAEALGLTVLGLDMYPSATKDFYPVLTGILNKKPEAIYCTALPHLMGGILKSARELGFNGPIFNLSPTSPEVVRALAGKDAATNCIVPAPDVNSPGMTPMIKDIRKMIVDKYKECNFDYLRQWDAFWWMVQAIEKAQSLDPTEVAKTWEKMENIKASSGTGKMGGQQSYGINHIGVLPFAVTRLMNAQMEHVGWFVPEIP